LLVEKVQLPSQNLILWVSVERLLRVVAILHETIENGTRTRLVRGRRGEACDERGE
jgi:hypothetical protein